MAVDGVPEVVRDGENGFLVAPGDVGRGGRERVGGDPRRRCAAGSPRRLALRDGLEEFGRETMVRQQEELYRELVAERGAGRRTEGRVIEAIIPGWFAPAVAAAYGLVFGSFLNVVIYRLPRGMSLVRPRSHCPACGATVRWFDNVPLLSYLLLRGRCRACRARISVRYPLVELASGALAAAVVVRFGLTVAGRGGDAAGDAAAAAGVHRPRAPPAPGRADAAGDRPGPGGVGRGRPGRAPRRARRRGGRCRPAVRGDRGLPVAARRRGDGPRRRQAAGDDRGVPRLARHAAHPRAGGDGRCASSA